MFTHTTSQIRSRTPPLTKPRRQSERRRMLAHPASQARSQTMRPTRARRRSEQRRVLTHPASRTRYRAPPLTKPRRRSEKRLTMSRPLLQPWSEKPHLVSRLQRKMSRQLCRKLTQARRAARRAPTLSRPSSMRRAQPRAPAAAGPETAPRSRATRVTTAPHTARARYSTGRSKGTRPRCSTLPSKAETSTRPCVSWYGSTPTPTSRTAPARPPSSRPRRAATPT
mmetsp:Transcript_76931/g.217636  ORF Transcript_76931/g.217636 Transcript_76931/m.217636 type:complete len:225 (+) Transcript_76931:238-912(+)